MAKYPSLSFDPQVRKSPGFCTWMTRNVPPQITVVVYDKDGSENHWSGLIKDKIDQVIAIENQNR